MSQREFLFLNQRGLLDEIGWDGPQREKLWRYNQHYFDDLNARDADLRHGWHEWLVEDWISRNRPGQGVGWDPYPTSLRIVNWIKWSLGGGRLSAASIQSLAIQARWLAQRLEFHLLGNHLFANAKALVFAGLFFEGPEADTWLKTGLSILTDEIPEQILADGGHFERSTMYHALALEDVLDLCNVIRCYGPSHSRISLNAAGLVACHQSCERRAPEMFQWLKVMQHPDGEIGFFNDAAFGVAPSSEELEGYAGRLGFSSTRVHEPLVYLQHSGYVRLQSHDAVALIDVAPIGPDYLPGHAHADTLSFELSVFGQRLLVNSGTSCYGVSAERLRQRGTAAHNTVVLGDHDSSEVWGGFRVARRAKVHSVDIAQEEHDAATTYAEHDGFARLTGKPIHARRFRFQKRSLSILDEIRVEDAEAYKGTASARFHLHPAIKLLVSNEANTTGTIHLADGQQILWNVSLAGRVLIEPTTWHPRFGESAMNLCLVVELLNGQSELQLNW